ncbi:MAG: PrgI family protein [bacterium]
MQQFTVPQFIDVEDKVIGPLSVRQFIIVLVSMGIIAISYKVFDFSMFLTIAATVLVLGGVFAFIKINGSPFHYFLLNLLQTLLKPRLRVWNKNDTPEEPEQKEEAPILQEPVAPRRYSTSHLNKLALIVDTKGCYAGEDEQVNIQSDNQLLI